MHLEDSANRSGCVAGHQINGHRSAADRDLHAVGGDNVALRLSLRKAIDGFVDHIPIARSHDNMRAIAFLHQLRAADFVLMGMGYKDVFNLEIGRASCRERVEIEGGAVWINVMST